MSTIEDDWESRVSGDECPLCAPRPDDSDGMCLIRKLSVSSLYLNRSQTYRGAAVLVYDNAHVTRVNDLSADEWARFAADLHRASSAVVDSVDPDHVNVESLGNVVPHLHFHIVPRYKNDGRWRDPIWLTVVAEMPAVRIPEDEFQALRSAIDGQLGDPAG